MKQKTRDNLIYLAVGLGIAAIVVADAFYAVDHDVRMWVPTNLAFRAVAYMALLDFFVARETQRAKATPVQTTICVLIASVLHLGFVFVFRESFSGRSSVRLWALTVLEIFIIVKLMKRAVHYFRPGLRGA
ncbi:MAG: hypothetical protein WA766_12575 [Candidatus Acidiferrales bacterium]|jgi:membrane-associated HD superfamily phosphohydrolase